MCGFIIPPEPAYPFSSLTKIIFLNLERILCDRRIRISAAHDQSRHVAFPPDHTYIIAARPTFWAFTDFKHCYLR